MRSTGSIPIADAEEELICHAETATSQAPPERVSEAISETMEACARELRQTAQDLERAAKLDTQVQLASGLESTTASLGECYRQLHRLQISLTGKSLADPCRLLNCQRFRSLESAIRDGIIAIERTKSSFKSKELGTLRRRLKEVLERGK